MQTGFIITELQLTGPNAPAAFVRLTGGLNVISGPSNTGKTYIFQCINYMLGGSTKPKRIVEATQYAHCYLEIQTSDDKILTLKSDLNGGDFHLYECAINSIGNNREHIKLTRKHKDDDPTSISNFLLRLCNLESKKIKINVQGKKRGVSFRDLTKLQLIDEVKIITDKSPITTGQYISETAEKSILKLLITGTDDSALIELLSKDEIKNRKGKVDMLNELISESDKEINTLNIIDYDNEQLSRIQSTINSYTEELKSLSEVNDKLTKEKLDEINSLTVETHRKDEMTGLQSRSIILGKQYDSDIARLQSTIEACELLNDTTSDVSECPVCHSDLTDTENKIDLSTIFTACTKELQKIDLLKQELNLSQKIISEEIDNCERLIRIFQSNITTIELELKERAENRIKTIVESMSILRNQLDKLKQYEQLVQRKKELIKSRDFIASSIVKKKSGDSSDGAASSYIYPLCEEILAILKILKYPGLKSVSFNEDKNDFVITGQDRELAGKGFRAITYSAFVIGLHRLVATHQFGLPIPILDSPLVTYRKPDSNNEDISVDLAMDFYRYIVNSNLNQVIIMENEEPPEDIESEINHIIFTQSTDGRYGFIPSV